MNPKVEERAMEMHRERGLATRWDCCPEEYRAQRRKEATKALGLAEDGYPHPIDQWGE